VFPRLLQFGSLTIPTHGACVALGLVLALMLSLRTARVLRLDEAAVWDLGFIAIIANIMGGRMVLFVTHWREIVEYPRLVLVVNEHSPAVLWGGIAVMLAAGGVYLQRKKLPVMRTLDAIAAPLMLASAMACVGDFAAGAGFGSTTNVLWAVTYSSRFALAWSGTPLGVRVHPVQMYEAALELLLCAGLLWLLRTKRHAGEVMGAALAADGVIRFMMELYRGERGTEFLDGMQKAALGMIVLGGMLWMRPGMHAANQSTQESSEDAQ